MLFVDIVNITMTRNIAQVDRRDDSLYKNILII